MWGFTKSRTDSLQPLTRATLIIILNLLLISAGRPWEVAASTALGDSLLVRPWTTEEGLPQSSVIALTQTHEGYLWMGTMNGLARFDGSKFTQFDESISPQLGSGPVVFLFEDSRNNLWVGTRSSRVILIRSGNAIPIRFLGDDSRDAYLVSAAEQKDGTIWFYFSDGQLFRYANGQVNRFPIAVNEAFSRTRQVISEHSGETWVGMDWQQIGIEPATTEDENEAPRTTVQVAGLDYLLPSKTGGYWRLASGRIEKLKGTNLIEDFGEYAWADPRVTAACEDDQGHLIVGTSQSGVYWYDADRKAHRMEGLTDDRILSLCLDREGDLWVGTDGGGLNQVKRSPFVTLPGTEDWVIQSTSTDAKGGVWIGCNGGQLAYWLNDELRQYVLSTDLPSIKSVAVDNGGRVWAGTWGRGLFRLESDRFQPIIAAGLFQAAVIAIHQGKTGTLWLGLQETSPDTRNSLARIKDGRLRFFIAEDGLPPGPVSALMDDSAGNLWIGTAGGGLARMQGESFTRFQKSDGVLGSDDIAALFVDSAGTLWAGTIGGGLSSFQEGRWRTFSKQDGLPSNRIGYLAEDNQGYLWLGSDAGLLRMPRTEFVRYATNQTDALACRIYGRADGLPTRECTLGSQPAATTTPDGRLWFPTIKGLVTVDPTKLQPNPVPPPVVIDSIQIDGQERMTNRLATTWPEQVKLKPDDQLLEIAYTSLNLSSRDRTQFRYRLDNHDPGWIDAGADQVARYTQLPPGDYQFHVAAANEDDLWSSKSSTLAIVVLPPFWKTGWFIGISTVTLLGLLAGTVYLISTQRLQRQLSLLKQQEALERERARIARDLHDQLGANLTQISLLGELAEVDKDQPEEVGDHARQICGTARETTRALDEIVWAANPSNDSLEGLVNYICKYAQDYLALAGIRYRLQVPSPLPAVALKPELRHNVFLAAKEAVNNVVKHAQATEARVTLTLEAAAFTLEVADNGRGPAGKDTKAAKSRNGLRNMRKRMEDLGGQFTIQPAPDGGCVVRLTAPLKK